MGTVLLVFSLDASIGFPLVHHQYPVLFVLHIYCTLLYKMLIFSSVSMWKVNVLEEEEEYIYIYIYIYIYKELIIPTTLLLIGIAMNFYKYYYIWLVVNGRMKNLPLHFPWSKFPKSLPILELWLLCRSLAKCLLKEVEKISV